MTLVALVAAAVALAFAWRARRAAAAALAARRPYELLAAHVPDVSMPLYDRELRFTLLEGSALPAHGWRREEIEGRAIADVIPPDRLEGLLAHCRAALAGEPSSHDWAGMRGGAHYTVEHVPLRDGRGAVTAGMIVLREVSEQLALQRELEAQRGFLAGVLDQLSDHVVACDAGGRLHQFGDGSLLDVDPLDWPAHFGLRAADGSTSSHAASPQSAHGQPPRRAAQPVPLAQLRQGLAGAVRVLGQRLERQQPRPQVLDPDGRDLEAQPRQPAHRRPLEPLGVLVLDQQADRQRVVEVDAGQLGGRRANQREPADAQGALETGVGAALAAHANACSHADRTAGRDEVEREPG